MKAKLMAALSAPLLLNGCMMAGMAGMGGMGHVSGGGTHDSGAAAAPGAPTIVKEVVAGGLRVTAEFPTYAPGDLLSYTVTLRDLDGRTITTDASVFLEVSPATMDSAVAAPAPTHAGPPAKIAHAMPGGLERMRFAPAERAGGRFVFRPSIPRDGAYRLTVLVEGARETVMDPPIVVDQVVQLLAITPEPSAPRHAMRGGGLTPLVLLGAGFMAVMMLFALR